MKPQSSGFRSGTALILAVLLATVLAGDAGAQRPERRWRSNPYGRMGAEVSVEFPRFGFATGRAYSEDRDVGPGMGIGFGLTWGLTDNIAIDGRMVQTNHTGENQDSQWDIDQVLIGARYNFNTEKRVQPFVGLGFSRVVLERDNGLVSGEGFERVSWYGWCVTAGVDFVWNRRWLGFVRADYSVVGSGTEKVGTDEGITDSDLGNEQRGNVAAITIGVAYRIPSW
ncbi:MAG: outer membrane beta-barrel protein [Candidatus Eisenbacteria bacterium]|nr:outer membrane beta-barrel protein [Candidatus Eisenbacteria bacterium]